MKFRPISLEVLMRDREWINAEATRLLSILSNTPFSDCHPLTREFAEVTPRPGIYAFRHNQVGMMIQMVRPRYNVQIRQEE